MELNRSHNIKQKSEDVLCSIIFTVVAGIFINLGLSMMTIFSESSYNFIGVLLFILCAVLGFIIIPEKIAKYIYKEIDFSINLNGKRTIVILLLFLPTTIYLGGVEKSLFFLLIAICEEYLFRHILLNILSKRNSVLVASILGSLIFATVLHSNYNILDNLLIRMPFSLIFYYAAIKYKLQDAIMLHWMYNIITTIL